MPNTTPTPIFAERRSCASRLGRLSCVCRALTVIASLCAPSIVRAQVVETLIEGWRAAAPLPAIMSAAPHEILPAPLPDSPATSESSAATSSLTLAQLEELSTTRHPTLREAAYAVRAAEARALQAGFYPNPTFGYIGEEMGEGGRAGQQGGFVRQELVTAGKLGLRRALACQEAEQARWVWQVQCLRVRGDVRRHYYESLAAQRSVELNRRLTVIGEECVKAAASLYRAQEVSRIDELQARIELEAVQLRLHEAEQRRLAAWRQLASTLGAADLAPTTVEGDLEQLPAEIVWEAALTRLLQESPQLAEARAGVERARRRWAVECAARVPNLDVSADVRHNNETHYTTSSVELGVPLPMFHRNQGNIAAAQAEIAAADAAAQRLELSLQERLAAVYERYASALDSVRRYRESMLPKAKQSLDLVQAGYRQGELGYQTLLTAQRTHYQAQLTYLDSLRQLHLAASDIEHSLLQDSLAANVAREAGAP